MHMALGIDDILFGIQAAGDIQRGQLRRAAAQIGGILTDGQGMQLNNEKTT